MVLKYISLSDPRITGENGIDLTASFHVKKENREKALLYAGGFRNWYYGRWNGETVTRGENKLDPELMEVGQDDLQGLADISEDKMKEFSGTAQPFYLPETYFV